MAEYEAMKTVGSAVVVGVALQKTNVVRKVSGMISGIVPVNAGIVRTIVDVAEMIGGFYMVKSQNAFIKGSGLGLIFDGALDIADQYIPQL